VTSRRSADSSVASATDMAESIDSTRKADEMHGGCRLGADALQDSRGVRLSQAT
jgi:hypothetical protein